MEYLGSPCDFRSLYPRRSFGIQRCSHTYQMDFSSSLGLSMAAVARNVTVTQKHCETGHVDLACFALLRYLRDLGLADDQFLHAPEMALVGIRVAANSASNARRTCRRESVGLVRLDSSWNSWDIYPAHAS